MAPPLEYDKEPKAPDKSAATISNDDSKLLHSIVNDQQTNSDHKPTSTAANIEGENKQVVNLDDGQLRALLDEAMNYKCPKDLEGKSNLFKELLEEVQQDEQQDDRAGSATARVATGRSARRLAGAGGGRGRAGQLLQSNSLQDLVAALAAEPAPRRSRHHAPTHPPAPVSARAIQGGSLPSGVDTSFLLGEEPSSGRGAGYLATVRCVNPPPLAERRVSASDANSPAEVELLHRRSKPVFPMTYTARATLEIGSGAVCSGRAVTTTTASNQVRTAPRPAPDTYRIPPTCGPPERIYAVKKHHIPERTRKSQNPQSGRKPDLTSLEETPGEIAEVEISEMTDSNQQKLINALRPRGDDGSRSRDDRSASSDEGKNGNPRGPSERSEQAPRPVSAEGSVRDSADPWMSGVNSWYDGLAAYNDQFYRMQINARQKHKDDDANHNARPTNSYIDKQSNKREATNTNPNIPKTNIAPGNRICDSPNKPKTNPRKDFAPILSAKDIKFVPKKINKAEPKEFLDSKNEIHELHRVKGNLSDTEVSDIRLLRKKYRETVGKNLVVPSLTSVNPRNIRSMTISKTPIIDFSEAHQSSDVKQTANNMAVFKDIDMYVDKNTSINKDVLDKTENIEYPVSAKATELLEIPPNNQKYESGCDTPSDICNDMELEILNSSVRSKDFEMNILDHDIELQDVDSNSERNDDAGSFLQYCADQKKLFQVLEANKEDPSTFQTFNNNTSKTLENSKTQEISVGKGLVDEKIKIELNEIKFGSEILEHNPDKAMPNTEENNNETVEDEKVEEVIIQLKKPQITGNQYVLAELPNNAYVFLTLPKRLLMPLHNKDQKPQLQLSEKSNSHTSRERPDESAGKAASKKKKDKVGPNGEKKRDAHNKNALRALLFENLKRDVPVKGTSVAGKKGDSAIPFSCITTPEVVASCNTTSSTAQAAIAVDPKPLQLGSGYRAVASLTGAASESGAPRAEPARAAAAAAAVAPVASVNPVNQLDTQDDHARQLQVFVPRLGLQPRSVISSSFNGLPLSRPNYGATSTAGDDYKKSLDENGNAVQGFSSPVSGSSQHKKPRRKKSSKNETVIKSHQIDGYKGNCDLNEVLRFIESDAEHGRGKFRAKHKHDADDKGKKRSTERRKDKESKLKRATSLEELSRTKLEDLTEPRPSPRASAPAAQPKPKPERRSWGDEAAPPAPAVAAEPAPPELTDFQTVTKRRKPRRRADEPEREPPPRRPRPPDARPRRESAPPSDRSNDSNDDLDSVHSLPADAPARLAAAPAHASYADIARTRHNIPDLIESCNFYAEEAGDGGGEGGGAGASPPGAGDAEYPALGLARGAGRGKPPARRDRKDRPAAAGPPDCPAPDVVSDRRPPVILLDSAARPRDMDGVTFGFDINEQLLGGSGGPGGPGGSGPPRPRCDLVRDALDTQPPDADADADAGAVVAGVAGVAGVAAVVGVAARCGALRYVAPAPADTRQLHQLHQLVDYVGNAWEDVVRCGGGKVRYFSE